MAQELRQCGLQIGGFTVKYERTLESLVITIDKESGASAAHFDCILKAAEAEIVIFDDPELGQAYADRVIDLHRPKMLADARAELTKYGALVGFPERSDFGSDKQFAEALEGHCGMKPGAYLTQDKSGLFTLRPQGKAEEDGTGCLMAAILYVNATGADFRFGFIGNEEAAQPDR